MTLSENIDNLISTQSDEWTLLRDNLLALESVQAKSFDLDGNIFRVQFNPTRIISSAAKVDPRSIAERQCFLCRANRPAEQRYVEHTTSVGNNYQILCNPYPIAPRHLTIASAEHTPQLIAGRICDMAEMAMQLPDFVLFYNGPQCGASAPDHFHFQACNRDFLILDRFSNVREDRLSRSTGSMAQKPTGANETNRLPLTIYSANRYPVSNVVIRSENALNLTDAFDKLYSALSSSGEEPMLNILCWTEGVEIIIVAFPRRAHRPSQFFDEGEQNMLISPASIDLGGVFITPRESDFERIAASDIEDILNQICSPREEINRVLKQIAR